MIVCILMYICGRKGIRRSGIRLFNERRLREIGSFSEADCAPMAEASFFARSFSKSTAREQKYLFLQENKYFFEFPLANLRIVCYNVIELLFI